MPGAFNPPPQPLAPLVLKGLLQHIAHMSQTRLSITTEGAAALSIIHKRPNGGLAIVRGKSVQVLEQKSAPGRSQNRQPVGTVALMQQCMGQTEQILYRLSLGKCFDFHSLIWQGRLLGAQRLDQGLQV